MQNKPLGVIWQGFNENSFTSKAKAGDAKKKN